jgi:hypothetical protein
MTHDEIFRLSACAPEIPAKLRGMDDVEEVAKCRFLDAYLEPAYGWTAARLLARYDRAFPAFPSGGLKWVWRAYLTLRGQPNTTVQTAWRIRNSPDMAVYRGTLEGALVIKDASVKAAAEIMGIKPDLVEAYDALFWNVLDRKKDLMYLASQVYPAGRLEEIRRDYIDTAHVVSLLRRIGYNQGPEDLRWAAGLRTTAVDSHTVAEAKEQSERLTMTMGLLFLRNFGHYSEQHVAISSCRMLMQAAKLGGIDQGESGHSTSFADYAEKLFGDNRQALIDRTNALANRIPALPA